VRSAPKLQRSWTPGAMPCKAGGKRTVIRKPKRAAPSREGARRGHEWARAGDDRLARRCEVRMLHRNPRQGEPIPRTLPCGPAAICSAVYSSMKIMMCTPLNIM
jgi:hypothetical protein